MHVPTPQDREYTGRKTPPLRLLIAGAVAVAVVVLVITLAAGC
jgi:hypothetical protein